MLKKLTIQHLVLGYLGMGGVWMVAIGFLPVLGQSELIPEYFQFAILVTGVAAAPPLLAVCAYRLAIRDGPPPGQSRLTMHGLYLVIVAYLTLSMYECALITAGASDPNQGLMVFVGFVAMPVTGAVFYFIAWGIEVATRYLWRRLRGGAGPGA